MQNLKKFYRKIQDKRRFFMRAMSMRLTYFLGRLFFPKLKKKGNPKLSNLGVVMISGSEQGSGIFLPKNYSQLVDGLYADVRARISKSKNCNFRSADESISQKYAKAKDLPENTEDIPEVREKKMGTIRLKYTLDLNGLEELCQEILPQVEGMIYHCPVKVEKATVYRHSVSVLPEYASILWHSDNHFEGVTKIMIYFTEVGPKNAPFEYLRHKETGEVIHVRPSLPQKYPQGRVPEEVIQKYKKEGFESFKVTGKARSIMIFDDKIIHKGNYAEEGFRDVLVLQLNPAIFRPKKYIDKNFTLSF